MGGIISGILGALDGGASEDARGINRQMIEEAQKIPLPVLKKYYPELYKQIVALNPEKESAVNLGPSEMAGIGTDPAQRQAQMNALNKLQSVGMAGGRDAQFMADQSRLESDVNANTQGQEGAIEQNMAARGMGGGGGEMVARNIAAQQGANRQAQMGMDANAQAQSRALQALSQSGSLAGQMQSQDFNQQSSKAQAADSISKFNAQNTQQVQNNNVNTANEAQKFNATNAQGISNQNTGLNNNAQQYNLGLDQQNYDNELKKRGIVSNAQQNLANSYQHESDSDRQFVGGLISAGAGAYGASKYGEKK